jgi:ssDNA-binding Zn-finger/Zn-ribbon topoisomerase 1
VAEIRCPKCGSRMIVLTTTEDAFRYYICSNRPTCTERIAVEDAFAYMWEEGKPAGMGAGGIKQSEKSSQSRARTAASRLEEGKLRLALIFKRSKHKDKVPVDEVLGNDWDREIHEPKLPPYLPQRPKTQKKHAASKVKETSEPRSPVMPKTADSKQRQRIKQASPEREDGRGDDWDDEIPATRAVVHKPKLGRIPQAASRETEPMRMREVAHYQPERPGVSEKKAASERKELPKAWSEHSHEGEVVSEKETEILKEKKPSRHWWQRMVREETAPEAKGSPNTQQKGASARDVPSSSEWPRTSTEEVPLKKGDSAGPWLQTVPDREVAPQTVEPLRPQPQTEPKPEITPEAKKPPKPQPRLRAALKKAVSIKGKRLFRHWWRRAPEREAANKGKELSKPRPQIVLKRAASPDEKELLRPVQQGTEANLAVSEIKEPDKPVEPMAPEAYEPDRIKESSKSQPQKVMQSDMKARKKKRFLIIIIIAIVVACIVAIDGIIYAAFVLR